MLCFVSHRLGGGMVNGGPPLTVAGGGYCLTQNIKKHPMKSYIYIYSKSYVALKVKVIQILQYKCNTNYSHIYEIMAMESIADIIFDL